MAKVDILVPTCNRLPSLIMPMTGVANQTLGDVHVIVSDQSAEPVEGSPVLKTLRRIVEARGGSMEWRYRVPSLGIAEQSDFLLQQAKAEYVLYLDDDVFMQPWVVERLVETIGEERCAFVGAFPSGLSFIDDVRPQQQFVEFWEGPVGPEDVDPDSPKWERYHLHRAANTYHVSESLPPGVFRRYKVAWIASCILYDRAKLLEVGGFSFWSRLPSHHSVEQVLVQNLLMRK